MSIRKRKWTAPCGEVNFAWVVDFKDLGGRRRLRTFRLKKEAERYHTRVRSELLDAELKAKGPATAPTVPDHGSTNPGKEKEMNSPNATTTLSGTPALPAGGEAMPGQAIEYPLLHAIYSYRAAWNAYLAASIIDDDAPQTYKPELARLKTWDKPAVSFIEAEAALRLAMEEHETGGSDVAPTMVKAVHSWLLQTGERRAEA